MIKKINIEGISMEPAVKDGATALIDTSRKAKDRIKDGDIIAFRTPNAYPRKYSVKRVNRVTDKGKYFVLGDNKAVSIDSRSYGAVEKILIEGLVIKVFNNGDSFIERYKFLSEYI